MTHRLILQTLVVIPLLSMSLMASAADAVKALPIDTAFSEKDAKDWTLTRKVPDQPSLTFSAEGDGPGLKWESVGFDILSKEWDIGTRPFEMSADIELTGSLTRKALTRSTGVMIVLSSAPVDKMQPEDIAIIWHVYVEGIAGRLRVGGAYLGQEVRPNTWWPSGQEITRGRILNQLGGAGMDYSVLWPDDHYMAGTNVRIHLSRDVEHRLHFTIYHGEGLASPWWESTVTLPETATTSQYDGQKLVSVRDRPLRYVSIVTARNAGEFKDLAGVVRPQEQFNGTILRLQGRELAPGEKLALNEPLPAAVIPPKTGWKPKPLVFTPELLKAQREKAALPMFKPYLELIREYADAENDRKSYHDANQNGAFNNLFYAWVSTGDDEAYMDRMIQEVDRLVMISDAIPKSTEEAVEAGTDFPGTMHQMLKTDTFYSMTTAALALAYDALGEQLGAERRDRIRYRLVSQMKRYLERPGNAWWWFANPSNTIAVGGGSLGIAAVVMKDEEPELSAQVIEKACNAIDKIFVASQADGGYIEGNLYWNYALGWQMLFGWSAQQALGTDYGLLTTGGMRNSYNYVAANYAGDGNFVPFNDTQPWLTGIANCALAGSQFDIPVLRWFADHMARHYVSEEGKFQKKWQAPAAGMAFLFRDTVPAPKEFPGLPNVFLLPSTNYAVLRSNGAEVVPKMVTSIKGNGTVNTHHADADQSSFVFYANGEMVLMDPGYFHKSGRDHNLPVIESPARDIVLNPVASAPIESVWESGNLRAAVVDATKAYELDKDKDGSEHARRLFVQIGDKALIVLDDLLTKTPAPTITAQYQAAVPAEVTAFGALLNGRNGQVSLQLFGPAVKLEATPREFYSGQKWIYDDMKIPWHTLGGQFPLDPAKPLVSVLSRLGEDGKVPDTKVDYQTGKITVSVPGEAPVVFVKDVTRWAIEGALPTITTPIAGN